jgi:alpha-galactosidase
MSRDEHGTIQPDPAKFPNGIPALIDYVHSKNLKFGLYSCN